jgi:hypothetical protein
MGTAKWEYDGGTSSCGPKEFEDQFFAARDVSDKMGAEGWEMVNFGVVPVTDSPGVTIRLHIYFVMKRQL